MAVDKFNLDILLVDDDKEILALFSNSLKYIVNSIDIAKCAKDALVLFDKNRYDVIITDLSMPHMSGQELIESIKKIDDDIQIIVASAYSNEISHISSAIEMGVTRFLTKPINMNLLRKILEEIASLKSAKQCMLDLDRVNKKLNKSAIRHLKSIEEKDSLIAHQSKNVLMGEMFAMITHQLKQPVSASMMQVGGLQMKLDMGVEISQDELEKNLNTLMKNFEYFKDTIEGFNLFYKTKTKTKINLLSIVNSTLKLIEPTLKKHQIDIKIDIKDDINFCTYENEFRQVLLNLVNNAKDAIVEEKTDNPYIEIVAKSNDENIYLYIIDSAGSLDIKCKDKIFDEHYSTKGDNGTGLGLYMTKLIVEKQLNGTIDVNVAEGKTVFKILFSHQ
jgi:signal transduction histidine kinase